MKRILSTFVMMLMLTSTFAGGRLFHVSRNLNRNIIVYDIQLRDGELNLDKPLHVYWYNQEHTPATTNELNFIQRKMAYGYSVTSKGKNEVRVKLKAWNKREVRICKQAGKWVAIATINGRECILTEIYAHCPSKTSCDYLEITGRSIADGKIQKEKVTA